MERNTNSFLITLLSILLTIVTLIAGFFAYQTHKLVGELRVMNEEPKPTLEPVSCTLEAKLCPDGSAVGRSGPNCEFTPCPTTSP